MVAADGPIQPGYGKEPVADVRITISAPVAKIIGALIVMLSISVGLNVYQIQKIREARYFYESAMITWAKQAANVKDAKELEALVAAVKASTPRRMVDNPQNIDFGFFKESSGTWKAK